MGLEIRMSGVEACGWAYVKIFVWHINSQNKLGTTEEALSKKGDKVA